MFPSGGGWAVVEAFQAAQGAGELPSYDVAETKLGPGGSLGNSHVWANTDFRSVGPKSVFARDATARVRVGHASSHPVALQKGGKTVVAVGSCHDQALTTPLHLGGLLEADQTFTVRQYSSERGAWGAEETAKGPVLADLGVRTEAKGYHILEFTRMPRAGSRGRGGRR